MKTENLNNTPPTIVEEMEYWVLDREYMDFVESVRTVLRNSLKQGTISIEQFHGFLDEVKKEFTRIYPNAGKNKSSHGMRMLNDKNPNSVNILHEDIEDEDFNP